MVSASPLEALNPLKSQGTIVQTLATSYGPLSAVTEFLPPIERIKLQGLSRHFYNKMIPQIVALVETPQVQVVLESGRKNIMLGTWSKNTKECKSQRLLKIGKEPGDDDPDLLGFSEIYFQWMI